MSDNKSCTGAGKSAEKTKYLKMIANILTAVMITDGAEIDMYILGRHDMANRVDTHADFVMIHSVLLYFVIK